MKLTAHTEHQTAGIYRNLETGLQRRFLYRPVRGRWERIRPLRHYYPVVNGFIYWTPPFAAGRQALEAREGDQ